MEANILVVGGAGYIGSHTAKLLRIKGYNPFIFDNFSTGHKQAAQIALQNNQIIEGHYADKDLLKNVFKKNKISAVMHFGAKALVGESVENPGLYYRSNVSETLSLLEAMIETNIKYFIFSSTCAVFGIHEEAINEAAEKKPINPYGKTKLFVEEILRDFEKSYSLVSGVLRYFNAAGADPDGELGEDHDPETHLIPNAINAVLQDCSFRVHGNDYPTLDGSCIRDYIHVNDLAEAHIRTLEFLVQNKRGCDFNLGTGKGFSVFEIIEAISKAAEKKVPYEVGPRRGGDPARLVADASKANQLIKWKAQFNLDQIVQTALRFKKDNPQGFRK